MFGLTQTDAKIAGGTGGGRPKVERLPNVQILRAIAAMMIVVHHCGIETMRLAEKAGSDRLFNEAPWGSGVPIFFAISGFIMVVTSANAFGSTQGALDFMRRRIIRIVPLYWLVTTVGLAALLVMPAQMKVLPNDYGYIISSYLFWPAMRLTGDVRPLATPGWTLNLEMFFYIVFAIALLFPRRFGLPFLFSSLGLLVCARVSGLLPGVALNFWGDPIVLGFLLGAAVGVIYIRGIRLSAVAAAALTIVSFAVLWQVDVGGPEDTLFSRVAFAVPSTFVLAGFALGPQIDERWRFWWPALIVGDASYSLYLVHEFLLRPIYLVWQKVALNVVSLWYFVPLGVVISLIVALATYYFFEKPVTRWLNDAWRKRAARSALPQPVPARV
ncbi:MAG: acyltransferase [Rhizobiales bacterium]|nr:acyltransferase [Hyphomicrobiales bacterium]